MIKGWEWQANGTKETEFRIQMAVIVAFARIQQWRYQLLIFSKRDNENYNHNFRRK